MALRFFFNWLALEGLDEVARAPLDAIRDAGYDGVQFIEPLEPRLVAEARERGLRVCGSGRVNQPEDAERLAREAVREGLECLTLHVGWGTEDDTQAERLLGAVLHAHARHGVPLYPETHRATVLQDMWRAAQFVRRLPDLRLNGDFSHWYTGQEMVYGGFEEKLAFIQPVVDRVRFLHGRIGDPGCMQVDVGDGDPRGRPYVEHFRALWTSAFRAYLRDRRAPADFIFAPELLAPRIYYGRMSQGREETDRWAQSQVLVRIARDCFEAAQKS